MLDITSSIQSAPLVEKFIANNEKLELIEKLLFEFHIAGIKYCHWKSNAHLDASMTGDTDLDILFDTGEKEILLPILTKLGFKYFSSVAQKQYKEIEDFIGLDASKGKIVHLHAHFKLTLGEPFLKSYQLNLEDAVLGSRVYVARYGIYSSSPAFEYVLLFIRLALKFRNRDIFDIYFNKQLSYTGNLLNEYNWLKEKFTLQDLEAILPAIFKNYQPVLQILVGDFNRKQIMKLSFLIKNEFKNYRRYNALEALAIRWFRETSFFAFAKLHKKLSLPVIKQRTNPRGGLSIAFIGADGSGKSTVIKDLQHTFGKKIDVQPIYFGKGSSGKKSHKRVILEKLKLAFSKRKAKPGSNKVKVNVTLSKESFARSLYECLQAILIANEKQKNIKLMNRLVKKGALVIGDRFPQNQVMGINDGPSLSKYSNSKNWLFNYFSKLEARKYAFAEANPPDIVFKLITDLQTSILRKPNETPIQILNEKVEGIKNIYYPGNCKVVNIDANKPLQEVLATVKMEIWDAIL